MPRTDDYIICAPARHPKLWFDDDSVILVAEAMFFRVHSSILCKLSSLPDDIFSIQQPLDDGSDTLEGD